MYSLVGERCVVLVLADAINAHSTEVIQVVKVVELRIIALYLVHT